MMSLVFSLILLQPQAAKPNADKNSVDNDIFCGSRCLYVALKSLDSAPSSYEVLQNRLGDPAVTGYALRQLQELASSQGVNTTAVKTSLDNLVARSEPFACITMTNENHFVLISNIDDSFITLVDPPNIMKVPVDTFLLKWGGNCLLISKSALETEESLSRRLFMRRMVVAICVVVGVFVAFAGIMVAFIKLRRRRGLRALLIPFVALIGGTSGCGQRSELPSRDPQAGLMAQPSSFRLGVLETNGSEQVKHIECKIINASLKAYVITEIVSSCNCTVAEASGVRVEAGQEVVIKGQIKIGNYNEVKNSYIALKTTDPLHPSIMINIDWECRVPIYIKNNRIDVSVVKVGSEYRTEAPVFSRKSGVCLKKATVTIEPKQTMVETVFHPNPTHCGHEGQDEKPCGAISVRMPPHDEPGFYSDTLVIRAVGEGGSSSVSVPVTWHVVERYSASPSRLSLDQDPGWAFREKKIMIVGQQNTSFSITNIKMRDGNFKLETEYNSRPSPIQWVTLKVRSDGNPKAVSDTVQITIMEGDVVEHVNVPISVLRKRD